MRASRERVMLKAFFTQDYLDALSPRYRKTMEALHGRRHPQEAGRCDKKAL